MPKVCSVCGVTYSDALVFCPADGTTLRVADVREDLVGNVVADRYLVTDILGEGGMGTVYLARHVRLPQQSAIKVLRKQMLQDPSAVARFNREAANASRIDHDRVARVYDYGEMADGLVYLAMEYVPGKTLKALLAEGPLEPARAAELVRQIAEGLDAAHRMEIVHRDLKPENVMVIRDADDTERVKVVDFGIAKAFGDDASAGTVLTRTGFVVGTPEFMSPEQLLGGALDARSDIYALALVAYHCLTGELPFATNTPDFGMAARLVTPPRPLTAVRPSVRWPREVQAVFDQALARDPSERPTSAGGFARALAAAIDAWQSGEVEDAAPPPPSPRSSATVSPTMATVPAAPVAALAPPPAPSLFTAERAPAEKKPRSLVVPIVAGVALLAAVGGVMMFKGRAKAPGSDLPATPVTDTAATTGTLPSAPQTQAPVQTANAPVPNGQVPNTSVPNRPVPNAAASTTPPNTAPSAASGESRQALDSIAEAVSTGDEGDAQRAIPAITRLLPRLASRDDSTWAQIRLVEANAILNQNTQACAALRRARTLARTGPQQQQIAKYEGMLPCGG